MSRRKAPDTAPAGQAGSVQRRGVVLDLAREGTDPQRPGGRTSENTTRSARGKTRTRPLSVGFWFSLGHSSIVFALCLLLAFGVRALAGQVEDDGSTLHRSPA